MTLPTQDGVTTEVIPGAEFEEPVAPVTEDLAPEEDGAAPVTTEVAPVVPAVDEPNWQEQFEQSQETLNTLQGNMNTLKSNHDRSTFQMQSEFQKREEAMGDRLAELEIKDLPDDEKAVYLQKRELTKLENQSGQLDQREFALQQRESMLAWEDFFVNQIGLESDTLKRSEGFEVFHSGGWQGTQTLVAGLRSRNAQLEEFITASKLKVPGAPKVVATAVGKKPPKVQTKVPGAAPAKKRMADIPVHEREALYDAFAAGDIKAEDMPV